MSDTDIAIFDHAQFQAAIDTLDGIRGSVANQAAATSSAAAALDGAGDAVPKTTSALREATAEIAAVLATAGEALADAAAGLRVFAGTVTAIAADAGEDIKQR